MQRFIGLIVGAIFIAVGIFMYFNSNNLIKNCTVEAEATVVDMKEELSADDETTSYMYYPVIEYNANGNTVNVTMESGSNYPAYSIGDKIIILYNPNKTQEFIVKGDKSSNIFSIIITVIGVVVFGYGIRMALKKE